MTQRELIKDYLDESIKGFALGDISNSDVLKYTEFFGNVFIVLAKDSFNSSINKYLDELNIDNIAVTIIKRINSIRSVYAVSISGE